MKHLMRAMLPVLMTLSFLFSAFAPATSFAQVNVRGEFNSTLEQSGLIRKGTQPNVYSAIGQVVNTFLGLIGIAVFVLVVYAGALWILAAGNEDKVAQAKGILKGAIIGLVIVFGAYVIVNFTIQELGRAIGSGAPGQ